MKKLHTGQCILDGLVNNTTKTKHIVLSDGKTVIAEFVALPGYTFNLGIHCQNSLVISGQGSRGAYFDGFCVRWPEEA